MTIRPSVPEIITVNSEALQTVIRDLLPSQNGFGSELQASNVITPIIDLTAAAEGSSVGTNLQTALAFGSQTTFETENATDTLANSPGFWRVTWSLNLKNNNGATAAYIGLTDGLTTKEISGYDNNGFFTTTRFDIEFNDLTFFLAAGESIVAVSNSANIQLKGSYRQIATGDGTLVNPVGFPL